MTKERNQRDWNLALSVARLANHTGMVTMTAAAVLAANAELENLRRENRELREDVKQARSEEAHVWASRHNTLIARLQMVEDRYMALVKQVSEGAGLVVPQIMVAQLSAEFMQSQADDAPKLELGA